MRIVSDFPHTVREIENVWIPMADGCRLAARIWLPDDAEKRPVPAVLEYIPYRKRDFTRARDEPMHAYFAGHGYAAIRLDLRGSGDSDGLMFDEYLKQEQDDAVEAIAWIARQPWCSGAVGMIGKSWGGFNALQIAARRPPELKAIITFCSTDDRYADDVHYMGGCQLAENLQWGAGFFGNLALPPDPAIVGDRCRKMWGDRLEHMGVPLHAWLSHQRRDDFWKHGSVCESYDSIGCAVYAITGWTDGYSNAIFRLVAGLKAPCKGLIGPWGHLYAHDGYPGPAIGFLQEAVRWWDHWLKGLDSGIMDEPKLRVWMQESVAPSRNHSVRPGRWVAEREWPSPMVARERYALNPGKLARQASEETVLEIRSPQTTGLGGIHWCHYGAGSAESPGDQRCDDGQSLVFDTDPLDAPMEMLGAPVARLELASDRPIAFAIVRLNDVAPTGASTLVTFGILNLTHRDGHENPQPLEPGRRTRVRVQLNGIAHAFPAAHRIRLAISTCYWPMIWPSPEAATLSLFSGSSILDLPIRAPRAEDAGLRPFGEPESAARLEIAPVEAGRSSQTVEHDLLAGVTTWQERDEGGPFSNSRLFRLESTGTTIGQSTLRRFAIRDDDPLSASFAIHETTEIGRDDWQVRVETVTQLSATKDDWLLKAELRAYEGNVPAFSRDWNYVIPRDLM